MEDTRPIHRKRWHTSMLYAIGRTLREQIQFGMLPDTVQVAFLQADTSYFMASPEQTTALHNWYGADKVNVLTGMVHDAGAIVGINTHSVSIRHPQETEAVRDTDPLPALQDAQRNAHG